MCKCRCDEEEVEEDVKKRSAGKEAMGAKTLCIPLEQVRAGSRQGELGPGREALCAEGGWQEAGAGKRGDAI